MELNRKHLTILVGVVAVGVVAYVAYRWWQARQPETQVGGLGTNLNSIAPELIGGSSGPSVGPAVNTPITITLNEAANSTAPAELPDAGENMQEGVNARVLSPLWRQRSAVVPGIVPPVDDSDDSDTDTSGSNALDGGADESADDSIDQGAAA